MLLYHIHLKIREMAVHFFFQIVNENIAKHLFKVNFRDVIGGKFLISLFNHFARFWGCDRMTSF